jgi:PAS domain S-box-containing protein
MHFAWDPLCKENSERATCQPSELYQRLFAEAPVACFSISVDARIQAANAQASRLLGYRPDELLGRTVFDLYANGTRGKPKARELFLRFRTGFEINREDVEMRRAGGSPLWINLSVRPIRGADGHIVASCSVVEEILNDRNPFGAASDIRIASTSALAWHSCRQDQHEETRWIIKSAKGIYFLNVEEIDWIEAAGNYAQLHVGSRLHLVRETMNCLEARLCSYQFIRVHRRAIVNVARMKELQPCPSGDCRLILNDGTRLTLSRTYRGRLKGIWLT